MIIDQSYHTTLSRQFMFISNIETSHSLASSFYTHTQINMQMYKPPPFTYMSSANPTHSPHVCFA